MTLATRLTEAEEAFADTALLNLSRLRDLLVHRDANLAACLIDDAIHAVAAAMLADAMPPSRETKA